MSIDVPEIVGRFASALDRDDFGALAAMLDDDCEYVSPKGTMRGCQAIVGAYRDASQLAKAENDDVRYDSSIRGHGAGSAVVVFADYLRNGGREHAYFCEQEIHVNAQGLVCRIIHHELPGQREALDSFLRATARGKR